MSYWAGQQVGLIGWAIGLAHRVPMGIKIGPWLDPLG